MVVFPGAPTNLKFWRGSPTPELVSGEYVARDPQDALWYARNFARDGYVTGYNIRGGILDASRNPVEALREATGITDFDGLDEAWEILEQVPGVADALVKQGYSLVRFNDVAPKRGTEAYKYLGPSKIRGVPVLKVVSTKDIKKYLPGETQKLWGEEDALPATEHGWMALSEAQEEVRSGWDLEDPSYYLDSAPKKLYSGTLYQWAEAEELL